MVSEMPEIRFLGHHPFCHVERSRDIANFS
jgi:hypothetical protein